MDPPLAPAAGSGELLNFASLDDIVVSSTTSKRLILRFRSVDMNRISN